MEEEQVQLSKEDAENINEIREYLIDQSEKIEDVHDELLEIDDEALLDSNLNNNDIEVTFESASQLQSAIIRNDFPMVIHLVEIADFEVTPELVSFAISHGSSEEITKFLLERVSRPGPEHQLTHVPHNSSSDANKERISISSSSHDPLPGVMSVSTPNYSAITSESD